MAQKRYINYEQPLTSFQENQRLLGVSSQGRVAGFDQISFSGNTLTLTHSNSAVSAVPFVPTSFENLGIVVTKQGVVIMEDAPIEVIVFTNVGNNYDRVDLLVVNHQHAEVTGGVEATYSVIKGPNGGMQPQAQLSNDYTQTIIGTIIVKANSSNHSTTSFQPTILKVVNTPTINLINSYDHNISTNKGQGFGPATSNANIYEQRNFNNVKFSGEYIMPNGVINAPTMASGNWSLRVSSLDNLGLLVGTIQVATSFIDGRTYSRSMDPSNSIWSPWQDLNNSTISGFDPAVIESMIGSDSLANINYSSNNYVTDGESLETAIGYLDAAILVRQGNINSNTTNISNNLIKIGNLNYSSNNYVTDAESATLAIGDLDAAILVRQGNINSNTTNIGINATDIGDLTYAANNYIVDGEPLSDSVEALDVALALVNSNAGTLKMKVIDVGDWDMTNTSTKATIHGIANYKNIRSVSFVIRNDTDISYYAGQRQNSTTGSLESGVLFINSTTIELIRTTSGFFDSVNFSNTTYNRGWVTIWYV